MLKQYELTRQKLEGVSKDALVNLAKQVQVDHKGRQGDIVARLLNLDTTIIDDYIRGQYKDKIMLRQEIITDQDLIIELEKVQSINWGVVQGQLDQKIQREYVRQFTHYKDLVSGVKNSLHDDITNYVIASWFNHWSTVLIEDHISQHPKVVPTLKNIKGIDIFFDDHAFDLKITYMPKGYDVSSALDNPTELARWLYENQGSQRFGDDNRFYVVLVDSQDVTNSWKLKRDFKLVYQHIDNYLDQTTVSSNDILPFVYNGTCYTPKCKILIIKK